ncbi:MAG: nitronate monooxygenase [Pseudolysinimonas sp.]
MNAVTQLLSLELPIVLAPFGGLSSVELTAAVSNGGGLGSYGLYGYHAERIRDTGARLRAATDRPFALNMWLPTGDERDPDVGEFARAQAAVAIFFSELGLELPARPEKFLPDLDEQLEAVWGVRPAAVSFVFGVPAAAVIEHAHELGIVVMGTATTVDEAIALAAGGVDVVVATGSEAAGHRVSFLEAADQSLVGTFALIPQVVDAIDIPVVAAGGVADRRGVAAAFALGADAVQVGTAFLYTQESAANDAHRRAIEATAAHASVLTRAMSGRLARGAANRAIRTIESADSIAPFPAQNWLTGQFRAEAGRRGIGEFQSLWLGQSAALSQHTTAAGLLDELAHGLPSRSSQPE